jgi:hypothetical protein
LNALIVKLGLKTHVHDAAILPDYIKKLINSCGDSRFINPTKDIFNKYGFMNTLAMLRSEEERILNLRDTFSVEIFVKHPDLEIREMFNGLLANMEFSNKFTPIVDYIKKSLNLSNYKAIHLRLEDDWVRNIVKNHKIPIQKVYQQYLYSIESMMDSSDQIFLATHLTKSVNQMDFVVDQLQKQYPYAKLSQSWRDAFPEMYSGREIEAIVDYLVCRDAQTFLGWRHSTFSYSLMKCFEATAKVFVDVMNPPVETKMGRIIYSKVAHGKLGINGNLGYTEPDGTDKIQISSDFEVISAHAPSVVIIRTLESLEIEGIISPTSKNVPTITFKCDGELVGVLSTSNIKTSPYLLQPGEHRLTIETSSQEWAHSLWISKSF